jgi:hypothetical protein
MHLLMAKFLRGDRRSLRHQDDSACDVPFAHPPSTNRLTYGTHAAGQEDTAILQLSAHAGVRD